MRGRGGFDVLGWGRFWAVWEEEKLLYLGLESEARPSLPATASGPFLTEIARQVSAYLRGGLRRLELPYTLPDSPAFCRRLWLKAQDIPYGQVVSYGALAARAGNPRAARAAGNAMSINQLFLIVPCHRVIAAGGRLGGYGGRPELKERLLTLEGISVKEGRVTLPHKHFAEDVL
ncbi:MAG: methylated-DNA--[protein]-cysteine S-methyltransferase [Clostridiales bacterium]|nr:methylated-DNA--[protein]-cysteine S-methyltransferase [Clostridiales bacterium]